MLPAWATVLVALGASAIGGVLAGLLTTRLQIQHDREEQLRGRMITAADDFVTGSLQAQVGLWEAAAAPDRGSTVAENLPEMLRRLAEAHARLARVKLLFGPESGAGQAAEATINSLWGGRDALQRDPPATGEALQASNRALTDLATFTEKARAALHHPWQFKT